MSTSVVIPTRDEAANVRGLLRRVMAVLDAEDEVIFVDDGSDDLPSVVAAESLRYLNRIRVIRREEPVGGLGGAVLVGLRQARGSVVVVCDGDLQHPPEVIPELVARLADTDVAVASRYVNGGDADGLSSGWRRLVSRATGLVSRIVFPGRLRNCSDPMSGFFAVRVDAVGLDSLRPTGFKILLEILVRCGPLRIGEVPYTFAAREHGSSHASMIEGYRLVVQLLKARLIDRALLFMIVGASGILPNLAVMAALHSSGLPYIDAAIIGTQAGIVWNFVGAETLVWRDARAGQWTTRFVRFAVVGETDLLRLPIVVLLVEVAGMSSLLASLLTFGLSFLCRFTLSDKIIYRRVPVAEPVVVDAAEAA